jgi:pentose-5-phosphate-3-epimerase
MPNQLEKVKKIKKKYEKIWISIDGVTAVGIGKTSDGGTGLIVSVIEKPEKFRKMIPEKINGISIEIQVTGELRAF